MALLGFGGGGEDGFGEGLALQEPGRHRFSGDGPLPEILLPRRAGDVTAHDALDVDALGPHHHHCLAGNLRRQGVQRAADHGRGLGSVGQGDEMVGHNIPGLGEPEGGHVVQDQALIGNAVGKDNIEGGEPIGGHHQQQIFAEEVGIPYLSPVEKIGQVGFH